MSESGGQIYVNYGGVENAADDMVQQTRAIASTISQLEQELRPLVTSWVGSDADVYHQKQAAWDGAVRNMEQLLTSHAALLGEISGHYKYSENSLSQQWANIRIGG